MLQKSATDIFAGSLRSPALIGSRGGWLGLTRCKFCRFARAGTRAGPDVLHEFAREIGHGTEDAACNDVALYLAEPNLHLVQPDEDVNLFGPLHFAHQPASAARGAIPDTRTARHAYPSHWAPPPPRLRKPRARRAAAHAVQTGVLSATACGAIPGTREAHAKPVCRPGRRPLLGHAKRVRVARAAMCGKPARVRRRRHVAPSPGACRMRSDSGALNAPRSPVRRAGAARG